MSDAKAKPSIVLLPGHMCDQRLFAPQLQFFSQQYNVIVPRFLGASISEMASHILAEAPERFALGGLSMGGIVAMEILRQQPQRVERLALMDTNPLPEAHAVATARDQFIAQVKQGHLAEVMREELKPKYLADSFHKQDVLDVCMAMALDLGEDVFIQQAKALRGRPDQQSVLKSSKLPTLIMCGEFDQLCPLERHQLMHELMPHAQFTVIPNAGHLPVLEQPEASSNTLSEWLNL